MPWRTLCGFPPTSDTITLRIPNGAWRPDTVVTDYEGTELFVLLDQTQEMRSYEAIFGDLEGRRLVCIKRHLIKAFWRDGYYFCTYTPNYKGQKPLADRDMDNKRVYPFSYLQVSPMKGRYFYRTFDNQEGLSAPKLRAENPWLGYMVVCCTPLVRTGKWTASFQRRSSATPTIHIDQWRNCVDVGPGNDLLAALCMAYVFDRSQCQPLVTVFGLEGDTEEEDKDKDKDNSSIASKEDDDLEGGGDGGGGGGGATKPYKDEPAAGERGMNDDQYDDNGNYKDDPNKTQDTYKTDDGYYDDDDNYHGNGASPYADSDEQRPPEYDEYGNPIDNNNTNTFDDGNATRATNGNDDWRTDDLLSMNDNRTTATNGTGLNDDGDAYLLGGNNGNQQQPPRPYGSAAAPTSAQQQQQHGKSGPYSFLDDDPSVAQTLDPSVLGQNTPANQTYASQPNEQFAPNQNDDASWLRDDDNTTGGASPSVMDAHFKQHQQRQEQQQQYNDQQSHDDFFDTASGSRYQDNDAYDNKIV